MCRVSGRRGRVTGGKVQKLDAAAVGEYSIAVNLRRVRDGHMFSEIGHYGLPSGTAEERVANSRELATHAAALTNVVVLGDFNIRPCKCFRHFRTPGEDTAVLKTWELDLRARTGGDARAARRWSKRLRSPVSSQSLRFSSWWRRRLVQRAGHSGVG